MVRELALRIALGTPTTGIWCGSCNLPAAVRYPVHTLRDDGVRQIGGFIHCHNCKPVKQP